MRTKRKKESQRKRTEEERWIVSAQLRPARHRKSSQVSFPSRASWKERMILCHIAVMFISRHATSRTQTKRKRNRIKTNPSPLILRYKSTSHLILPFKFLLCGVAKDPGQGHEVIHTPSAWTGGFPYPPPIGFLQGRIEPRGARMCSCW